MGLVALGWAGPVFHGTMILCCSARKCKRPSRVSIPRFAWKWLFSNPKKTGYCDRWGYKLTLLTENARAVRYHVVKRKRHVRSSQDRRQLRRKVIFATIADEGPVSPPGNVSAALTVRAVPEIDQTIAISPTKKKEYCVFPRMIGAVWPTSQIIFATPPRWLLDVRSSPNSGH